MFRIVLALLLLAATAAGSAYAIINGLPAVPVIASICTTQGSTAGGDTVVITGSNMNNVTGVTFGGVSAGTKWFLTDTNHVTAISPAGSGTVDVRVANPAGTSAAVTGDQFTYVTPSNLPTITSITPNNGTLTAGDFASIIGTNLGTVTTVNFGSSIANGGSVSAQSNGTAVYVRVPANTAGTVNVTVSGSNGTSVIGWPRCGR